MSYLVCIDPGHAKNTAGKRSPDSSLREYEFNRDVAKRLNKLIGRIDYDNKIQKEILLKQ